MTFDLWPWIKRFCVHIQLVLWFHWRKKGDCNFAPKTFSAPQWKWIPRPKALTMACIDPSRKPDHRNTSESPTLNWLQTSCLSLDGKQSQLALSCIKWIQGPSGVPKLSVHLQFTIVVQFKPYFKQKYYLVFSWWNCPPRSACISNQTKTQMVQANTYNTWVHFSELFVLYSKKWLNFCKKVET